MIENEDLQSKNTEGTEGTCRPWYKNISTVENHICSICTLNPHI